MQHVTGHKMSHLSDDPSILTFKLLCCKWNEKRNDKRCIKWDLRRTHTPKQSLEKSLAPQLRQTGVNYISMDEPALYHITVCVFFKGLISIPYFKLRQPTKVVAQCPVVSVRTINITFTSNMRHSSHKNSRAIFKMSRYNILLAVIVTGMRK